MLIVHHILQIKTEQSIGIYNLTPQIQAILAETAIANGQALVCSRHTTTALGINEYEERLLVDIQAYLEKLAPRCDRYLHNDLHLRDVPADEPENAHSHLMALTLSSSEVIPIIDGKLALGTYQDVLLFELDGPRSRTVQLQLMGQ